MADPETSGTFAADLTDLPLQPTGSGVADAEIARMQAELADSEAADASIAAGIADESAAYDAAIRDGDRESPTKTQA